MRIKPIGNDALWTTAVCTKQLNLGGLIIIHFIIPFWKFGPPYLGKAIAATRAELIPSPTNAC